jgi:hypothetical protein
MEDRIAAGVGGDKAETRAMVVWKIKYDDKEINLMILNK